MLRIVLLNIVLAGCMWVATTAAQETLVVFRPIDGNTPPMPSLACLDAYDRVDEASAQLAMSSDILRLCAANEDMDGDGCKKELKRVVSDQSDFHDAMMSLKKECSAT
jgi:hypothetical protein